MEKRLNYIDSAKGILIFLVIWTHISTWGTHFFNLVFSFHMAAFFILSGYLMSKKHYVLQFVPFAKERFTKYIGPYFLFCTIGATVRVLLSDYSFLNNDMIESLFLYMQPDWLYFGAGWFLWALFFGNLGLYFWVRVVEQRVKYNYLKFIVFSH